MLRLQRFLKLNTSTYVCKKSKVFSSEHINTLLKYCSLSKKPSETLMGVGVSLIYYGLLRVCDERKVQCKDVIHESSGQVVVKFEHYRKKKKRNLLTISPPFIKARSSDMNLSWKQTFQKR